MFVINRDVLRAVPTCCKTFRSVRRSRWKSSLRWDNNNARTNIWSRYHPFNH